MKNSMALRRLVTFLLALSLCLLALVGCTETIRQGDDNGSGEQTSGTPAGGEDVPPAPVTEKLLFAQNKQSLYQIIYAPGEEYDGALNSLTNTLRKAGITYNARRYSRLLTYDENALQILLGDIPFPEAESLHTNLRPTDALIRKSGNKICISGGSADAVTEAMNYFLDISVKPALAEWTEGDFYIDFTEYSKVYAFESITLGGVPLQDYTIVYNTNDSIIGIYNTYTTNDNGTRKDYINSNGKIEVYGGDCKKDAELLRDEIAKLYGWQLNIQADTEPATEHEILLPGVERAPALKNIPTLKPMHSYAKMQDGHLVFSAYGTYSMRLTGKGFANYLKAAAVQGKHLSLDAEFAADISCLDFEEHKRAAGTEVRFVTSNIAAAAYNWGGFSDIDANLRKELLYAEFAILDADVYGLQEVCPTWAAIIKEAMSDEYVIVHETSVGKNGNTVENNNWLLYRKDKFREIARVESPIPYDIYLDKNGNLTDNTGAKIRNMNWVVLEDIATGKRFGYANTHWDWKVAEYTDKDGNTYEVYQNYEALQYARLLKTLASEYQCPMFACGDFNCRPIEPTDPDGTIDPKNKSFPMFLAEGNLVNTRTAAEAAGVLLNDPGSTHAFPDLEIETPYYTGIDQIVYTASESVQILSYFTLYENGMLYLSDHVPRCVDVKFN